MPLPCLVLGLLVCLECLIYLCWGLLQSVAWLVSASSVFACLFVYLFVFVVCLPACLLVCFFVCLFVCVLLLESSWGSLEGEHLVCVCRVLCVRFRVSVWFVFVFRC